MQEVMPGSMLNIGVSNPTSMINNASKFADIPFDVCFVSETSTILSQQKIVSKNFKKEGINILWGRASPSQRVCSTGVGSIRGSSLGVAMLAKMSPTSHVTVRPSRDPIPEHWDSTC